MKRLSIFLAALLFSGAAAAADVQLEGPLVQGGLVTGQTAPGSVVYLDGRELRLDAEGRFIFGLDRDQAEEIRLWVIAPNGRQETFRLAVQQRDYEIDRIDGAPPRGATPDRAEATRLAGEARALSATQASDRESLDFKTGWTWPLVGEIASVFGAQRVVGGAPGAPEPGVEIVAPEGARIRAAAAGLVTLAAADFTDGGVVVLDHGGGVTSTYRGLGSLAVGLGEEVEAGARIGRLGAPAAGGPPRLAWRVRWFDRRLDPVLLAGPMPQQTN